MIERNLIYEQKMHLAYRWQHIKKMADEENKKSEPSEHSDASL